MSFEDYECVSVLLSSFFFLFLCVAGLSFGPLIACEFLFRFALREVLVVDVVKANLGRSTN